MDDKELIGKHLQYAFPDPGRAQSEKQREKLTEKGMSLRDYFAAKAPSPIGFHRKLEWKEQVEEHAPDSKGNTCTVIGRHVDEDGAEYLARWAYHYADAMLAAREA